MTEGAVQRLARHHEAATRALLEQDTVVNLFLLGFLRLHGVERAHWFGVVDDGGVRGCVLVVAERLVVPWAPDSSDAAALGRHLRGRFTPCMMVGPRAQVDALWETWTEGEVEPERYYDQRLYVIRDRPLGPPVYGFRRARPAEWKTISIQAGLMEQEDLGRNPRQHYPVVHDQVVRERVKNGRTWVISRDRQILFQINIGTALDIGSQVGGTWVPPEHRGQGLATDGMRALCQHLLGYHPFVSLHVNEANAAAVRVYEKVGFVPHAPFRLITVA